MKARPNVLQSRSSVKHTRLSALLCATLLGSAVAACGGSSSEESIDEEPVACGGDGVICTLMGDGRAALGQDGVEPLDVSLYLPQDVTIGPDNLVYVLDWNNHRVRAIDEENRVRTVIGTGELGDAPDGHALKTRLNHPTHVSFSPSGRLILSAWHNSKVMEMNLATKKIKAVCGTGARSYAGEGEQSLTAAVDLPVATAFDSQGRMYIMDQGNQRIRRIEADGTLDTLVGPVGPYEPEGYVELCSDEVPEGNQAPDCKFCRDEEGATFEQCKGPPARAQGFAGEEEPGTEAFMNQPFSQSAPPAGRMEMGPKDVLYFTDSGNHLVRALKPNGEVVTIAGTPPKEYAPTELLEKAPLGGYRGDGTAEPLRARFNSPRDVAVDQAGNLFIADTLNSCVRRLSKKGELSTVAGICEERGFEGDGQLATEALLDRPYGIAVDDAGNLYIADTHNHRIRVVYGASTQ